MAAPQRKCRRCREVLPPVEDDPRAQRAALLVVQYLSAPTMYGAEAAREALYSLVRCEPCNLLVAPSPSPLVN